MTAAIRLFTIDARRSVALWFVPALVVLVAWGTVTTMRPDGAPAQWARSSVQFGLMCVVAAFIMCGVGAWVAGRERRRQTEDLLATMPRPASLLDVTILAGTVIWGLAACLLAGAIVFAIVDREATWGGLEHEPIVVGLLTVVAGTAIGYAGGMVVPSRLAAPLVAVGFASVVLLIGTRSSAIAYLSPMSLDPRGSSPYDVFYRASEVPAGQMALWLTGVAGCACAATALWRRSAWPAWSAFVVALAVAATGAVLVMQSFVHPPWERIYAGQPLAEYEPVCVERSIPVCFHPAYAAQLEGNADPIGRLVEPLVGVPGGPVRAEQLPERTGLRADGTLEVMPGEVAVARAIFDLVHEPDANLNSAQRVIAFWLMERTDENPSEWQLLFGVGQPDATVAAAVERFSALGPDAQRAWLMANYQDLRAGRIEIEELP